MELSGHTTPYAVLGHPIGHSLSPVMHNAALRELGLDAVYLAFDVAPEKLMGVLPAMADMGFGGVNLTVPLKEVAFKGLSDLDESARSLGAVNTVEITDNGLRGHNTDGAGFLLAMDEAFQKGPAGLSVFVFGVGGAGRALAITCAVQNASRIVLCDVDLSRPKAVAAEIQELNAAVEIEVLDAGSADVASIAADSDLVIQASPIGMKESDSSPLSAECFSDGQMLFDLVYMFPETDVMKVARERGARVANGMGMLLHQGARAFSIWTGKEPAVAAMRAALEQGVYGK